VGCAQPCVVWGEGWVESEGESTSQALSWLLIAEWGLHRPCPPTPSSLPFCFGYVC